MKRLINYAGWPVATGLAIALAVLLWQPSWLAYQGRDAVAPRTETPLPENLFNEETTPATAADGQLSAPASYAAAVQKAAPAVVNIYTTKPRPHHPLLDDPAFRQYFNLAEPPEQKRILSSMGSGVIVSEKGYILTNHHVINGADEFFVFLNDGRQARATPIGANTEADLAVLKIDLEDLTAIPLSQSHTPKVGDVALAIGNPFGFGQSVSQGIVSATSRLGQTPGGLQSFLQTDAAINPGNSGGALIDVQGNLLGINTATLGNQINESTGIGFAIPASVALQVLDEIIQFSDTVHGYLGVSASPLTPRLSRSLNLSFTNGLVITNVDENSPASNAGLQPWDVITRVNDQQFEVDGSLIAREISSTKPGESVEIEIWRDGRAGIVTVVLAAAQATTSSTTQGQPHPASAPAREVRA